MGERDDVLVGPEAEEVSDSGVRLDQHEGNLCDVEREELRMKGRRFIGPVDKEELLFAVSESEGPGIWTTFGKKMGLRCFFC